MSYAPLTLYPAIDGDDGQAGRVLGATSHDRSTWQRVVRRTNSIHGACEAVAGNIGLSIAKPQLASTRQNVWADLRRARRQFAGRHALLAAARCRRRALCDVRWSGPPLRPQSTGYPSGRVSIM